MSQPAVSVRWLTYRRIFFWLGLSLLLPGAALIYLQVSTVELVAGTVLAVLGGFMVMFTSRIGYCVAYVFAHS